MSLIDDLWKQGEIIHGKNKGWARKRIMASLKKLGFWFNNGVC